MRITSLPMAAAVSGLALASLLLTGCSSDDTSSPEVLKMGAPPGEAGEYKELLPEVASAISDATSIPVEFKETSDYLSVVEAMRSDLIDVAMFSPFAQVLAKSNAGVKPLVVVTGAPYSSVVACSAVSGITDVSGVQDASIAFVDPGSTSGNFIPRLMLAQAGIDVDNLDETFAGGHDSAMLAMGQGSVDCAAVASQMIDYALSEGMLDESDFTIVTESDDIPISLSIGVRDGLSEEIAQNIKATLLEDQTEALLAIVGGTEIIDADDADWTMFRDAAEELGVQLEDVA